MAECRSDRERHTWHRELRRYGTLPHAGFGLGFERTIRVSRASPTRTTQFRSREPPATHCIDAHYLGARLPKAGEKRLRFDVFLSRLSRDQ